MVIIFAIIITNMKSFSQINHINGFMLKEVLTATSIMFLGAVSVIPMMAFSSDFEVQRNLANAKQMIAFYDDAKHDGANLAVGSDPLPTVIRMMNGTTIAETAHTKRHELKLNSFTPKEIADVMPYLTVEGGNLKLKIPETQVK
jgi:hypothetical protein